MKFVSSLILLSFFKVCYSLSCHEIENKCEEYLQCLQENKMNLILCHKKHLDEIDWDEWYEKGCIDNLKSN